jgi:hypothetical protein
MGDDTHRVFEETPNDALQSMVLGELAFRGTVTDLSATRVAIETSLLGFTDTTVLEGSENEMEFIVGVTAAYVVLGTNSDARATIVNSASTFLGRLPERCRGVPLIISMLAPALIGSPMARAALYAAINASPEVVQSSPHLSLEDLLQVILLHRETGTPIHEIVQDLGL